MKPKFKTSAAWDQAETLLQPIFIRVVDNLREQLEDSPWTGEYADIQDPYPGYVLHLKNEYTEQTLNIWDVCYQVCFVEYPTAPVTDDSCEVDIDSSLFEASGSVDWQQLEAKTQRIIKEIFEQLPPA
ncbi:MAG: hypothetical protein WBB82_07200 [Limnothrix sp.]